MRPHELAALAAELPLLDLDRSPTFEEARAASVDLGRLGERELGLSRFRGRPPWERHPQDELLQVVAGSVELTLLEDGTPRVVQLAAGALLVVPARTWHRSHAADEVTVLYATPSAGNERSSDETPPGA